LNILDVHHKVLQIKGRVLAKITNLPLFEYDEVIAIVNLLNDFIGMANSHLNSFCQIVKRLADE
jgi:hypothetical protein